MLILTDLALFLNWNNLPTRKSYWKKGTLYSYESTSKSNDAKKLVLDTVTVVIYILKLSAHLDAYSLNIYKRKFFFETCAIYMLSKTVVSWWNQDMLFIYSLHIKWNFQIQFQIIIWFYKKFKEYLKQPIKNSWEMWTSPFSYPYNSSERLKLCNSVNM